jgi:hypothetical protein
LEIEQEAMASFEEKVKDHAVTFKMRLFPWHNAPHPAQQPRLKYCLRHPKD